MSGPHKAVPLVAPGHTRPVTHLSFSPLLDDGRYLLISGCKDGNPMLREWTGDWIGTFVGHKGAVWSTKLSWDSSRAASGSADFTACVTQTVPTWNVRSHSRASPAQCAVRSGTRTAETRSIRSLTITSSAALRSPLRRRICSPAVKKRRSGYLTSGDQMPTPIFWVVVCRTMARSRVLCGSTRTPA